MDTTDIILDTDIGPDCDDAAALALALIYTARKGRRLLGVTHCTSSKWGAGAVRAIANWYGRGDIAVGTLTEPGFLDGPECAKYNRALAMTVPRGQREAMDGVALTRRLLADAAPSSVEMIGIGPMKGLNKLLESGGDAISPLGGRSLIARAVKRLTVMAGDFSCDKPEWNVAMDLAAARNVASSWPNEIVWCGFEVGYPVRILKEPNALNPANPVRVAYRLHSRGAGRMSWDPCTIQFVLDPECGNYCLSEAGKITVDEAGVTRFTAAEGGLHRYVKLMATPENTARSLERALIGWDDDNAMPKRRRK